MNQGTGIIPMSGVHHHPLGLIDHRNIMILIQNIQRNIFGLNIDLFRRIYSNFNHIADANRLFFRYDAAVNTYFFFFDQPYALTS